MLFILSLLILIVGCTIDTDRTSCITDEDCVAEWTTCGCKYIATNKNYDGLRKTCSILCPEGKKSFVPTVSCVDNKCEIVD